MPGTTANVLRSLPDHCRNDRTMSKNLPKNATSNETSAIPVVDVPSSNKGPPSRHPGMMTRIASALLAAVSAVHCETGSALNHLGSEIPDACAADIVRAARDTNVFSGYAPRAANYCDGVAPALHGGTVSLRSATLGPVLFDADIMLVHVNSGEAYAVRGWDLNKKTSYRLDGVLSDSRLAVDVNAAIRPLELSAADVGLYAWRDSGTRRIYTPIRFSDAKIASFSFQSPKRLVSVTSISLCSTASTRSCLPVTSAIERSPSSGSRLLLTAELPHRSSVYRLSITVRDTRGENVPGLFYFEMPPNDE